MNNKSNINNENIYNSTINNNQNITQILANIEEYKGWKKELTLAVRTLASLSKNNTELYSEYKDKISALKKYIEDYEKQIKEAFSEIKVDLEYQQKAIDELGNLKFEEAIKILKSKTSYIEGVEAKIQIKSQELEKAKLDIANHYYLLALSTQTHYDNPHWFVDSCRYFECSIKSHSNKDNVFQYAYFLKDHNKLAEAEIYYKRYLNDFAFDISIEERAMTLNNLAILHSAQNRYEEALKEYEEALQIRRQLAEANPHTYLPDVATTLNDLANLHADQNRYEEALKEYEEALQIRRQLAEANPHTYLPDVATTLNNLATLHSDQNRYEEALKEYEEALQIRRQLAEANPHTYLPDVATTSINLAIFYLQAFPNREKSIELTLDAIKIVLPIVEKVPYTELYLQRAIDVLKAWDLSKEEIEQLITENEE